MKELTAFEMESVNGAGWLQDGLASLGSSMGASAWTLSSNLLTIDLPIIGTINLESIAPNLGSQVGNMIGTVIGFTIEGSLASIPMFGGFINKLLGN
ncbi:hypothetical protein M8013_11285 [Enterobacteriaceae bacterium H4N4]|uniref:Uncharacterized protein n=1 Tax=Silvania confinis TaxID=2926470 RepID=A0A9J6QBY4_9ENTR|nr:hypothetical protein [Silvania confinis]MCU6669328.1 hypothetical protein [Silvania confinis]